MKGIRFILFTLFITAVAFPGKLWASDSIPSLLSTIADERLGRWDMAEESFANPAINQWRLAGSLSEVGAGWHSRSFADNPDARSGLGDYMWNVGAVTYTKYRSSTLWGSGSYSAGKIRDVKWNETSDASLLYPYLLADSVGGDLSREVYRFNGGYADSRGRWAWGAELGYRADLRFRNVDPRPRNVVGELSGAAALAFRFAADYYASAGVEFMKYKQTNEVEFLSEMGVDKIFHLTGLGNHYNRFDGVGLSTYYTGSRIGFAFDIYPASGSGFFASCRLSRFTFKNILSDLNKLPVASVNHRQLNASTGWLLSAGRFEGGIAANLNLYRRHGAENIFGDATSSIFPVIGSNEMYADNLLALGMKIRGGLRFDSLDRVYAQLGLNWHHRTTAYIEPYSYSLVNMANLSLKLAGSKAIGKKWLVDASVYTRFSLPGKCDLNFAPTPDSEVASLIAAERGNFALQSAKATVLSLSAGANRLITSRYSIGITAGYQLTSYSGIGSDSAYRISLSFNF